MTTTTFDTHGIVKRLKGAGFDDAQAETVTEILRETRDSDMSRFVTKEYLDHQLLVLEQRLTIRMGGMLVVAVGAVAALVKLL